VDDLTALREFRAEVPDAAPEQLAQVRNRWTSAAESDTARRPRTMPATIGGRSRRVRPSRVGWGLAATGGLAVVVGVAVVAVQGGPGSAPTPAARPPAVTTVSSTQVLLAMATKAEARTAEHPRPDQWIYLKKLVPHGDGSGKVQYRAVEDWWRVDGTKSARLGDSGKVEVSPAGLEGDDRSPAQFTSYLQSLPTEPKALLNRIYQASGESAGSTRDEKAFSEILVLLRDATIISPQMNAALLRALTLIPDIRTTPDVVDVAGRHGVGISQVRTDGTREELILDSASGAYLGFRSVVEDAARWTASFKSMAPRAPKVVSSPSGSVVGESRVTPSPPTVHDGEVLHAEARVTTAVVNKAGQRP